MTATTKRIPGKRLKTWHRNWGNEGGKRSLRDFARGLIAQGGAEAEIAKKWAGGKVAP